MGNRGRWITGAAVAVFAYGLAGCVSVPDRQWSHQQGPEDTLAPEPGGGMLQIEINERGEFFDPEQFVRMKQWLSDDGEPVVLFVHGWHHNAQPDDANLASFRKFLPQIQAKTGSRIKGIYVGWRGDSLDPVIPMPEALGDFPTILGRKSASVVVGKGALSQIVQQLASYGDSRNVVLIGHSLGGSALYYASRDVIADELNEHMEVIFAEPCAGVARSGARGAGDATIVG